MRFDIFIDPAMLTYLGIGFAYLAGLFTAKISQKRKEDPERLELDGYWRSKQQVLLSVQKHGWRPRDLPDLCEDEEILLLTACIEEGLLEEPKKRSQAYKLTDMGRMYVTQPSHLLPQSRT